MWIDFSVRSETHSLKVLVAKYGCKWRVWDVGDDLSNGKTLWLIRNQTRIYAQVDDQSLHEITRTGTGRSNHTKPAGYRVTTTGIGLSASAGDQRDHCPVNRLASPCGP